MKSIASCILAVFVVAGCHSVGGDQLSGVYEGGVGLQWVILTLRTDHSFLAEWKAHRFETTMSGRWVVEKSEVRLLTKDYGLWPADDRLNVLLVRERNGKAMLIRKEDLADEDNPFFLHLEKSPNKSVQRTPGNASPASTGSGARRL